MRRPYEVGLNLGILALFLAPGSALAVRPVVPSCAQEADLVATGWLSTGNNSQALAISADGQVAVGKSSTQGSSKTRAFRFTESSGIADLGGPAGLALIATDVSGDGSVAVGSFTNNAGDIVAVRWGPGGFQELGFIGPTPQQGSGALGVSGDGQVIVGSSTAPGSGGATVSLAFRWTPQTGMQGLPSLHDGGDGAIAVSLDGTVAVGLATLPTGGGFEAARWENGRVTGLGHLPGSVCQFSNGGLASRTEAHGVSADGSVVVGIDWCTTGTAAHPAAVRWDQGGISALGALDGDDESKATGVSQDGSIIVGVSRLAGVRSTAVIWTAEGGTRSLVQVLENDYGVDTSHWDGLTTAAGVAQASFGTVIVGAGRAASPIGQEGFVAVLPCGDDDQDGLCNHWEEMEGIDLDGDGEIGVGSDILLPDADPDHMNLYVEVDFVGASPGDDPFTRVERAFADVPAALIGNPDGKPGITLHVELGDEGLTLAGGGDTYSFPPGSTCPLPTEFTDRKASFFGDGSEQENPELLRVKNRIYRYGIFGGAQPDGTGGVAEAFGNDFAVTLAGFDGLPNGNRDQQAGAFMHELGHTLGLAHAGPDGFDESGGNFKPNYHSVMNYLWIYPGGGAGLSGLADAAFTGSWVLDYSRQGLGPLDETGLHEILGLGGNPLYTLPIGPPPGHFVNEALPVDFNRDVQLDLFPVGSELEPIDINRQTTRITASPGSSLVAGNDWAFVAANLCDTFSTSKWDEGVSSCSDGGSGESEPEMTQADLDDLRALDYIDCNLNGVIDDQDLLGGSTDLNGNGVLDECEPLPGDLDGDEDVDADDRTLFADSFGSGEGEVEYLPAADLDADRTVALPDYSFWVDTFFGAVPLVAGPPAGAELHVEPALVVVDPGDEFELRIESTLPAGTLGFGLDLDFDPEIVEVVGDPVLDPAWTPVFARDLDGLAGLAPTSALAGSRRIATLTLRGVGPGQTVVAPAISPLDETEGIVLDGAVFADLTFGSATVRVIPEPGTAAAAVAALLALAARSRARRR